jgi:hypothetical protein
MVGADVISNLDLVIAIENTEKLVAYLDSFVKALFDFDFFYFDFDKVISIRDIEPTTVNWVDFVLDKVFAILVMELCML